MKHAWDSQKYNSVDRKLEITIPVERKLMTP
jgi:hypothetical protein